MCARCIFIRFAGMVQTRRFVNQTCSTLASRASLRRTPLNATNRNCALFKVTIGRGVFRYERGNVGRRH